MTPIPDSARPLSAHRRCPRRLGSATAAPPSSSPSERPTSWIPSPLVVTVGSMGRTSLSIGRTHALWLCRDPPGHAGGVGGWRGRGRVHISVRDGQLVSASSMLMTGQRAACWAAHRFIVTPSSRTSTIVRLTVRASARSMFTLMASRPSHRWSWNTFCAVTGSLALRRRSRKSAQRGPWTVGSPRPDEVRIVAWWRRRCRCDSQSMVGQHSMRWSSSIIRSRKGRTSCAQVARQCTSASAADVADLSAGMRVPLDREGTRSDVRHDVGVASGSTNSTPAWLAATHVPPLSGSISTQACR
jgi:hypothetical protein